MSTYAYNLTIGGRVTTNQLDELRAIILGNEDLMHLLDNGADGIPTNESATTYGYFGLRFERVPTDDLLEITEFCQEHDLSYELQGYSTVSDTYYIEYWKPGMSSEESMDTDSDWEQVYTRSSIDCGLAKLQQMEPMTAAQVKAIFDETLPSVDIPPIEIIEEQGETHG